MKVTCPRCGQPGYLTKVKVYGKYYMRVEHVENGKKRVCYLGRDAEALRQYIESTLVGHVSNKFLRFAGADFRVASVLRPRLERLCPQPRCTFVEVFGGSGYMSQTVSRAVFGNIVYNDINSMLVNLYRHVKEKPETLAAVVSMLPYSRSYHTIISQLLRECKEFASLAVAAMAFYVYNTTFNGVITTNGFSYGVHPHINKGREYRARVLAVLKYAAAWRDILIENLDFREIIKKYDAEKTVFYLDPPYFGRAEEYYGTPFTVNDLRDMAQMLTQIRGRFLLKVDNKTYSKIRDILPPDRYTVEEFVRKKHMQRIRGTPKGVWTMVLVSTP